MATFEAQVEALTSLSIDGSSAPTQTELTQFLTDGAKELINIFPPNLANLCSSSVSFTSGTASTLNTGKVLRVFRSDGDIKQPCRAIPAEYKGRYSDPDDMNYATITDPVFYVENNSLDVLPDGGTCTYSEVQYPAVAYGDSAVAVFPDEAEHLVAIYAAIKSLQNKMGSKVSDLPSDLSISAVPPEPPTISASSLSFSTSAPTYTTQSLTNQVTFSSFFPLSDFADNDPGLLTVSAEVPQAPSITTVSYTDATNVDALVDVIAVPAQIDVSGNAPAFTKPTVAPEFGQVSTHLDANEDVELASVKIQEVQAQISEYSVNIQNEQAEFNKENVRYQMEFQEAVNKNNQDLQAKIEDFRVKADVAKFNKQQDQVLNLANAAKQIEDIIADNSSKLQKFQTEISKYQNHVNHQIQEYEKRFSRYETELNITYQAWSKTESDNIAKYQADIQNQMQIFNDANVEYQAELQRSIENARLEDNEESKKIQKYSAELQQYQAEVNAEIQEFVNNMQKHTADYKWLESQHQKLIADYERGIKTLIRS